MCRLLKCSSPDCNNTFAISPRYAKRDTMYSFCKECRIRHSHKVLLIQAQHGFSIKEIILDAASLFQSVSGIADYLAVSFVTVYNWLTKYFKLTFQEFKRRHICKSPNCYVLNVQSSTYSRYDYILNKLKKQWYCACSSVFDKNRIMTNAPISVVQAILRDGSRVEKINDEAFLVVPNPLKLLQPASFGLTPVDLMYSQVTLDIVPETPVGLLNVVCIVDPVNDVTPTSLASPVSLVNPVSCALQPVKSSVTPHSFGFSPIKL